MNNITRQQTPVDTGLVYSIGPAVNLAELDDAMREFARQPWDLGVIIRRSLRHSHSLYAVTCQAMNLIDLAIIFIGIGFTEAVVKRWVRRRIFGGN